MRVSYCCISAVSALYRAVSCCICYIGGCIRGCASVCCIARVDVSLLYRDTSLLLYRRGSGLALHAPTQAAPAASRPVPRTSLPSVPQTAQTGAYALSDTTRPPRVDAPPRVGEPQPSADAVLASVLQEQRPLAKNVSWAPELEEHEAPQRRAFVATVAKAIKAGKAHVTLGLWRLPSFGMHAARRAFDQSRAIAELQYVLSLAGCNLGSSFATRSC